MSFHNCIMRLIGMPLPLVLSACFQAGDLPPGQRWWSHVAVLADDRFEGRKSGSVGYLARPSMSQESFLAWDSFPLVRKAFFSRCR